MKSDSVVIRKLRQLFMSLRWFSSSLNVHVGGESRCTDFLKKLHKGSKIKAKVRHYVPQNVLENTYFATSTSY